MRPTPWHDLFTFLSTLSVPTVFFWLLLAASVFFALFALLTEPGQPSFRNISIWLLRLLVGGMWWQQTLWKIPPTDDEVKYWMEQMVEHASIPLQSDLIRDHLLPNLGVVAPLVYLAELFVGISLMIGLVSRVGATIGALMAINLWLGLYSAPGEWPWIYGFLVIIQLLFVIDPPGRSLGADVLLRQREQLPVVFG